VAWPGNAFLAQGKWVITAQLLLMSLITGVIRHNRQTPGNDMWVRACSHGDRSPRVPSSAFSFSLGLSMRAHRPGRLSIGVIIAVSGAALLGGIENRQWEGRLFYGLAVFVVYHHAISAHHAANASVSNFRFRCRLDRCGLLVPADDQAARVRHRYFRTSGCCASAGFYFVAIFISEALGYSFLAIVRVRIVSGDPVYYPFWLCPAGFGTAVSEYYFPQPAYSADRVPAK
jgi:hypothetical protein